MCITLFITNRQSVRWLDSNLCLYDYQPNIPTRNSFAKNWVITVYGITQSKQLCIRKPVKTEYNS